ncbi:MAG: hypothetical protein JRI75_02135 [Deltaproteobacteria bacterium]|nr:hypothetical protein [Deltaproteobacteria bacterium]
MSGENENRSSKKLTLIIAIAIVLTMAAAGLMLWQKQPAPPVSKEISEAVRKPIKPQPVIDYNKLEEDDDLKELMQKRKAKYGIEKGVDIIVKSDESLKVGDQTVPMQEIVDKIRLKEGEIVENDIRPDGSDAKAHIEDFGIYVVQPGDNIWNIHFKFLRDYFAHRGISLSPAADEPVKKGFSSGVGKILKFSENKIYTYNLKEQKIDVDLNLIIPLNKIVIYNMAQVFERLDQINYDNVDRIEFDGESLWIPAEQ